MNARVFRTAAWSLALLLLLSCSKAPELPEGVEIVAGSDVEQMLSQCSRRAPEQGESTWQPAASDVLEFEARLTAELPHQLNKVGWLLPSEKVQLDRFPGGFWRQYVGIVRQGRRYIYGNFGPLTGISGPSRVATKGPIKICDGGPVFFGAEYGTSSKTITHWAFNGPLG